MQRNTVIAIILTFLIIVIWSIIQQRYFSQKTAKPVSPYTKQEQALPGGPKTPEISVPGKATPSMAPKKIPERDVSIETENFWALLSSEGATLKEFKFKKYQDRVAQSPLTIAVTDLVDRILGRKEEKPKQPRPLNLVNTDEKQGFPLGLIIDSDPSLSSGNWEVEKDRLELLSPGQRGNVSFTKVLDNGLKLKKTYGFVSGKDTVYLDVDRPSILP
jgi:YidC/Oxa1 family membrane protein insertase